MFIMIFAMFCRVMDGAAGPPPPQPQNAEGLARTSDAGGDILHYNIVFF
jgi:hypothetical protein